MDLSRALTGKSDLTLYSINCFGNFPNSDTTEKRYVQKLHRDFDGYNCLVFLIPLRAVAKNNGATEILDTQNELIPLECDAGEVVAMDPLRLHKASDETTSMRAVIWLRFAERNNLAMIKDGNQWLLNSAELQSYV